MKIFCGVFDKASNFYIDFVTFPSVPSAKRWFMDIINSTKENIINQHVSDYRLDKLANVNDYDGSVVADFGLVIDGASITSDADGEAVQPPVVEA